MTVQTLKNIIQHDAVQGQDTYPFDFTIISETHIFVYLDDILYTGGFQVIGIDDSGGAVLLDTPTPQEDDGKIMSIVRIVEPTQELDYTSYDGFPADSHEGGLDKLTMLIQQAINITEGVLHTPPTEDNLLTNTRLPSISVRADTALYFDNKGNVTVAQTVIDRPAVFRVDVQNGEGGPDSRSLLNIETVSGGANYPKVGFTNINGPLGPVQLDDQGKIPLDLINIIGMRIRGPYRGDDLCDKPGDDPGDCVEPDTRNPSERFPDVTTAFSNGDTFIISMGETEVSGTMNLFDSIGDVVPSILAVDLRDGIIFLEELEDPDNPGDIAIYEGWYLVKKLVEVGDARFIAYDDTGNIYVLGANVQVALDAVDTQLVALDNWFLTQRTTGREGLDSSDANQIFSSGIYRLPAGASNMPTANPFTLLCMIQDSDVITQMATDLTNGIAYTRTRWAGAWTSWNEFAQSEDSVSRNGDTMFGPLVGVAPTAGPHLARMDYVDQAIADAIAAIPPVVFPPPSTPAGSFMYFGAQQAPSGYLNCDGTTVTIANYPDLYDAIGTTWDNTNGAPSPSVGNFRLPPGEVDGLGLFLRNTGSVNTGVYQVDVFKAHTHTTPSQASNTLANSNGGVMLPGSGVTGSTGSATETRPRSITARLCIKT